MFLLSFLCTFRFPEHRAYYEGNYTLTRIIGNTTETTNSKFAFLFTENQTFCRTCTELRLAPNMSDIIDTSVLDMVGVYSDNYSSFFYFSMLDENKTLKEGFQLINKAFYTHNLTGPYNHDLLASTIANYTKRTYSQAYCFSFNISKTPQILSTFTTDDEATGRLYFLNNPNLSVNFTARQFDEFKFISEGKIFGLIASFCLFLTFLSWNLLAYYFNTPRKLSSLSLDSFSLHAAFDFSFGLFLFELSGLNSYISHFFLFLYTMTSVYYFVFISSFISRIWQASVDLENAYRQRAHLHFFFKYSFYVFLSLYISEFIFQVPYLSILFLYGYFIPQIYFSARSSLWKSNDTIFNILISISRLIPLYYFTLYKNNIYEKFSPAVAIFTTVYVLLQIGIIFLQNTLGPTFFLPKSMQPQGFSYSAGVVPPDTDCPICMQRIEPTDETMVTPCNHCFHKECLSRWMEEQLVCPVCRTRIPPTENMQNNEDDNDQVIIVA